MQSLIWHKPERIILCKYLGSYFMKGWIKLHRRIIDSFIFSHPVALKIWLWCLLKASIRDRDISLKAGRGFAFVKIKKGSFIFGRHSAEDILCVNGSTIYKWIKIFEKEEMITVKSNNQYSLVTILNYNEFQEMNEEKKTTKHTTKHTAKRQQNIQQNIQPNNTNKNIREVKEVKEVKEEKEDINIQHPTSISIEILKNFSFDSFWNIYDKKINKEKCEKKWNRISDEEKNLISEHLQKYIESTPDKSYRKHPLSYLNGKAWNDEIIFAPENVSQKPKTRLEEFLGKKINYKFVEDGGYTEI